MAESRHPDLQVSAEEKIEIASSLLPTLMHYLTQLTPDRQVRADDVLDSLALCVAAILENDTNIVTPKHTRMALDTVDVLVKRWAKDLRDHRAAPDVSFLSAILHRWNSQAEPEGQ
ncbi:hypothetical protein ACNFJ7_02340 [Sphingomonas sp. HT-1]|uniref:hypothetical protein n=1 Tax=unclassified Sphingomonas TaxID=196159 RepID=UPI0002DE1D26|nr:MULTISPECIES: hypothetical protein [unclassified Sphingomonas]KTF69772.1 hypothetical protein ATB93_07540 [Sphingomonas sp. WG]